MLENTIKVKRETTPTNKIPQ